MNKNDENINSGEKNPSADEKNSSAETPVDAAQQAQEEVQKWKNEYLYLRAEFDNYKKHAIKERADLLKFGAERVMRDFLEVMDNFERALAVKVQPDTINQYVHGIEMTAKAMKDTLAKHGLQESPSDGVLFDPNIHEALSSEVTEEVPEGHVSKTFKKAYKLHEKIIRPAQVIVAKAPVKN